MKTELIAMRQMFAMQARLNGLHGVDSNIKYIMDEIVAHNNNGKIDTNDISPTDVADLKDYGKKIVDFISCMHSELSELKDCTYWKHWCKEYKDGKDNMLFDVQNARVEVIDLWHFLITLSQLVGLDAEDVFNLYAKKMKVNLNRAETDYAMGNKTEDDNKSLAP